MNKYKFTYINGNGNETWVSIKAGSQVEAEAKIEKYLPSARLVTRSERAPKMLSLHN